MALRKIVRFPDPTLRQKTHNITTIDSNILRLIDDMVETMYAHQGAGLAAIQVGALERIFIIDSFAAGLAEEDPPVVFINPTIEWLSKDAETKDEGCLSFPSIFLPIKRSISARCKALDIHGKEFVAEGSGLYARAMQHEQDHLDNRLLYDFASPLKRQSIKRKMDKMTDEEALELVAIHGD